MKRKMTAGLVAVVAITALVISSGYAGADEQLTPEEIRDMVLTNASAIDTYSFDLEMVMDMFMINETGSKIDLIELCTGKGVVDNINQEMATWMNLGTRITDKEELPETTLWMTLDLYIVNNTLYMQERIADESPNWTKMAMPEEDEYWGSEDDLKQQIKSHDQLKQQLDFLNDSEVMRLEDAVVDGVDCYVLKIEPNLENYWDDLMNHSTTDEMEMSDQNLSILDFYSQMNLTMTDWIAKDTKFPMMTLMTMELRSKDLAIPETEEKFSMWMDSEVVLRFYDYNKPVSIELPAAAENATELTTLPQFH